MKKIDRQAGFSAVELLISMFIAVAFMGAGYLLFAVIVKDGSDARYQSRDSSIAYENLRTYTLNATTPCSVSSPAAPAIPATGPNALPNATMYIKLECPYGTSDPTTKLSVRVVYGTPAQEVTHAIFITAP
jgi:Tfp pilus assembly protein PilV